MDVCLCLIIFLNCYSYSFSLILTKHDTRYLRANMQNLWNRFPKFLFLFFYPRQVSLSPFPQSNVPASSLAPFPLVKAHIKLPLGY